MYILKQWYPSLPKDWKVGMVVGQGDTGVRMGTYSPISAEYTNHYVSSKEVINNPEFWTKSIKWIYDSYSGCYYVPDSKERTNYRLMGSSIPYGIPLDSILYTIADTDIKSRKRYIEFEGEFIPENPFNFKIGKSYKVKPKYTALKDSLITITKFDDLGYPEWIDKEGKRQIFTQEKYYFIGEVNDLKAIKTEGPLYEVISYLHKGSNHIWEKKLEDENPKLFYSVKPSFNGREDEFVTHIDVINKFPKLYSINSIMLLPNREIITIGDVITISEEGLIEGVVKSFVVDNKDLIIDVNTTLSSNIE